jgi:hypothetical protein
MNIVVSMDKAHNNGIVSCAIAHSDHRRAAAPATHARRYGAIENP